MSGHNLLSRIKWSATQKRWVAGMVQRPWVKWLMRRAIQIVVPRHQMGVVVVPLTADGQVLLLNHVFHPKMPWGPPGGWLDRKENPADCARRELKEETGLDIELKSVLKIASIPNPHHLAVAFVGYVEPAPLTLSFEIREGRWFHRDNLPEPLFPFTQEVIESAFAWHEQQDRSQNRL